MILGMYRTLSKLKVKCFQAIKDHPGILQSELSKSGIGHRSSILKYVFSLCFDGSVVRVRDVVMKTYRLYPRGKEPHVNHEDRLFRHSLYSNNPAYHDVNKGHGDKFFMAFDGSFGILYIDLKMIGGL